jgi:predicted chitinase
MVQDIVAEDFIQLTGRANYKRAGALEGPGKDLLVMGDALNSPERAVRLLGSSKIIKEILVM